MSILDKLISHLFLKVVIEELLSIGIVEGLLLISIVCWLCSEEGWMSMWDARYCCYCYICSTTSYCYCKNKNIWSVWYF